MPALMILLIMALSLGALGSVCRAVRQIRMPSHLRWELFPIPKGPRDRQRHGGSYFEETEWWTKSTPPDRLGQTAFTLKEVFLLRTVLKNFPALWVWSLFLHWGIYLYIVSTAIALGVFPIRKDILLGKSFLLSLVYFGYGTACALGVLGVLGLTTARTFHPRLKGFTARATAFNLCLLGGIFASGLFALIVPDRGLLPTLRDLVVWRSASGSYSSAAYLHFGLVAFFFVYFPFTHMTHMYLKYFTWHGVRWDDLPTRFDERQSNAVAQNLRRQVSWQAPHIRGTNPQSWADVASLTGQHEAGGHD
jgi:nitrate reductase gamma subunit